MSEATLANHCPRVDKNMFFGGGNNNVISSDVAQRAGSNFHYLVPARMLELRTRSE